MRLKVLRNGRKSPPRFCTRAKPRKDQRVVENEDFPDLGLVQELGCCKSRQQEVFRMDQIKRDTCFLALPQAEWGKPLFI